MELKSGVFGGIGLGGALAVFAALLAACDASDEESRAWRRLNRQLQDKQRLSAKAGRIAFELTNDRRKGHNIRIHTPVIGAASGRGRRTSGARERSALDARVWFST